jgi:hypothetical protein
LKITKSQLKQIIKEELNEEFATMAPQDREATEEDPDSVIQQRALEFFRNVELTSDVVRILVKNIAIPDLVTLMRIIPKIGTASEEEEIQQ